MSNLRPKSVPYDQMPSDCPYYLMDDSDLETVLFYPYPTLAEAMKHLLTEVERQSANHIEHPAEFRMTLTVHLRGTWLRDEKDPALFNQDYAVFAVYGTAKLSPRVPDKQAVFIITAHPCPIF